MCRATRARSTPKRHVGTQTSPQPNLTSNLSVHRDKKAISKRARDALADADAPLPAKKRMAARARNVATSTIEGTASAVENSFMDEPRSLAIDVSGKSTALTAPSPKAGQQETRRNGKKPNENLDS